MYISREREETSVLTTEEVSTPEVTVLPVTEISQELSGAVSNRDGFGAVARASRATAGL